MEENIEKIIDEEYDGYDNAATQSIDLVQKDVSTRLSTHPRHGVGGYKQGFNPGGGGHSTFAWVGMSGRERRNGGLKNWFFFAKVRSNELKIFNILRTYELKFGPDLGCRTENL